MAVDNSVDQSTQPDTQTEQLGKATQIESELADDIHRSVIHEQVEMGVAVRMACLDLVTRSLSRNTDGDAA